MDEVTLYRRNWWMFLVQGIVTLLFGIVAVTNPAQTLLTLGFFFGLFLLFMGLMDIIVSLSSSRTKSLWIISVALGALQVLVSIYLLQRPDLALATFITYVALALLVRAVVHLVEFFDSTYDMVFRTWHAVAAVASVLASVFIWRYPVKGTLAFVWVLGVFATVIGPLMIAFAIEAKNGFAPAKRR